MRYGDARQRGRCSTDFAQRRSRDGAALWLAKAGAAEAAKVRANGRPGLSSALGIRTGAHLAGGTLDVLRNPSGMTGIGLLCAAALGGSSLA